MVIGTAGRDTLAASLNGELVLGLGGDDILFSDKNNTTLSGGSRNDSLATVLELSDGAASTGVATQSGGSGRDSLSMTLDVSVVDTNNHATGLLYGGLGGDTLEANARADYAGAQTFANILIRDDQGHNFVRAVASTYSIYSSHSTIQVYTGTGDDTITANAGTSESASIRIDSGSGSDLVDASASGSSGSLNNYNDLVLIGGPGDDTLSTYSWTNTNVANGEHLHLVNGGGGDDLVDVEVEPSGQDGFFLANVTANGGAGNDTINSDITTGGLGAYGGQAIVDLSGGIGSDEIASNVRIATDGFYSADVTQSLSGGAGQDTLVARVMGLFATEDSGHMVTQSLSGGSGGDVLFAEVSGELYTDLGGYNYGIVPLVAGQNKLYGGAGNDMLTVVGGVGNVLDGGKGLDTIIGSENADVIYGGDLRDTIISGAGDDTIAGGTGGDTFVFDVALQGKNTITDWNKTYDKLDLDLIDGNGNGLADEVEASATITDTGTDVVVGFSGGTIIVFADEGTGSVVSIGELFSDPMLQLV